MGALGLFVAQIGQEGLYAYDRFTFGWDELAGGIALIPALVGAFGLAEVLTALADPVEKKLVEVKDSVLPRFREVFQYWRTVIRSGVIGVVTGLLPGVGEDSGAWMSYAAAKARQQGEAAVRQGLDRRPDGRRDRRHGVDPRPHHPGLALGIPGSAPSAVLMAAMIIHGIQPGPMLMISNPQFVYDVVAMTSLATLDDPHLRPLPGQAAARHPGDPAHGADADHLPALHRRRVRDRRRACSTSTRCSSSASAPSSCAGAATRWRRSCSASCSGRLLDKSLRRGLVLSDGSLAPFFTRPISLAFAVVTIFTILLYVPAFKAAVRRVTGGAGRAFRSALGRRGGEDAAMKIALCNEVLGATAARGAVRARRRARLRRPRDRAVHAGRRRRDRIDAGEAQRDPRASSSRPASSSPACTGCWSSPPACR